MLQVLLCTVLCIGPAIAIVKQEGTGRVMMSLGQERKRSHPMVFRSSSDKGGEDNSFQNVFSEATEVGYTPCLNSGHPVNNNEETLKTIFFINLDDSWSRRKFMEVNLRATGYQVERWNATTVADDKPESYMEFTRRGKQAKLRSGVGAAYLSHVRLLKHISMLPHNVYFVLEDDVRPADNAWAAEVMCQIRELPKNWDVYKFGFFDSQPGKRQPGKRGCSHKLPEATRFSCSLEWYATEYMGAQGYAVTPKGAKAMLAHLNGMPAMDIDGAMMNGQSWNGQGSTNNTNFYVAKQNLLIHGGWGSDVNQQ